jgi:hypothetical protein
MLERADRNRRIGKIGGVPKPLMECNNTARRFGGEMVQFR